MSTDIAALSEGLRQGSRRSLGKALTLIESRRPEDRPQALALLELIYPHRQSAFRLGISGSPGVGKSSFIEALGSIFLQAGRRLAILAVDPSSPRSAGSILGDKTRMEVLANHDACFIRPSPAGLSLGGVTRRTHEAILLCEAAGYDTILIETVGVGQSEYAISTMVDLFLFLTLPNAGDQLQGIKKGILELADLVIVTKADGAFLPAARQAAADHAAALHFQYLDPERQAPQVFLCSALEKSGLESIFKELQARLASLQKAGTWQQRRQSQNQKWYSSEIKEQLMESLTTMPHLRQLLDEMQSKVNAAELPPPAAAQRVISQFIRKITL